MAKKPLSPKNAKELPLAIIKQMIGLSTSGFGLVAALAWNEVVKTFVDGFIKPYLPAGSHLFALLIYAVIVTGLAVAITLQLTLLQDKIIQLNRKLTKNQTDHLT